MTKAGVGAEQIRVIHAPQSVGGNAYGLSKALRALNVDSVTVSLSRSPFQYHADVYVWSEEDGAFAKEFKRLLACIRAILRADIMHFNFGQSFFGPYVGTIDRRRLGLVGWMIRQLYRVFNWGLQWVELQTLRALRRPIFITYQGDDARQGDYCVANFTITFATEVDPGYYSPRSDELKRKAIRRFARHASRIYSVNPDLLHVLPESASFIPYSHVFMDDWKPVYSQTHPGPLRIAHAPSHRKVKGTELILSSLDRLKRQGYELEVLLVENLAHDDARRVYETADLVIDQLYAGWYGGLAVEAMALGKPVLTYIRHEDLQFIPPAMREELPVIEVSPSSIEVVLRQVLEMPRAEIVRLGRASRAFVERWHDPIKIAARLRDDYVNALTSIAGR